MSVSQSKTSWRRQLGKYFEQSRAKVFRRTDLASILEEKRDVWKMPRGMTTERFIRALLKGKKLKRLDFPFPYRKEQRYVWRDVPLLEILLTVKSDAYYTHHTAMQFHELVENVPETIYLNHEQRPHCQNDDLEQGQIDAAFKRRARVSKNVIKHNGKEIRLINGMHTGQYGVIEDKIQYDGQQNHVRFTNIERTLVDIAVRPIYAGGVIEVLNAYRLAQGRVSVRRLAAAVEKLHYVYPYHQAIGFYLEQAGYKSASVNLLRRFPIDFDFYLAHGMSEVRYVKDWRIYVPKDF